MKECRPHADTAPTLTEQENQMQEFFIPLKITTTHDAVELREDLGCGDENVIRIPFLQIDGVIRCLEQAKMKLEALLRDK